MSELHVERQFFHWVFHVIVIGALAGATVATMLCPDTSGRWAIGTTLAIGVIVYAGLVPMTVRVSSQRVQVTFGQLDWPRWRFPVAEMRDAAVIEFSPMRDFGGWGIRGGRKGMCLNQRGNRGVAFEFGGRRYIIGSDDPEALLSAMHTAGVPR